MPGIEQRGLYINQGNDLPDGAGGQAPDSSRGQRAIGAERRGNALRIANVYPMEFEHQGEWGLTYQPYKQLEDVDFSLERLAEERQNRELAGGVYIIVGVNYAGMGGALAREIGRQGGIPVMVGHTKDGSDPEVADLMEEVRAYGAPDAVYMQADISNNRQRKSITRQTMARFGRIDGLAIVAAALNDNPITEYKDAEIDRGVGTNVAAPLKLMRDYGKILAEQKFGRVVQFSSLAEAGSVGQGFYPGSKAFAGSTMRGLYAEFTLRFSLGRSDSNVDFSSLVIDYVPGTPMVNYLKDPKNRRKEERIKGLSGSERDLLPKEVGAVAAHLLNPNTHPKGAAIPISGRGRVIE